MTENCEGKKATKRKRFQDNQILELSEKNLEATLKIDSRTLRKRWLQ